VRRSVLNLLPFQAATGESGQTTVPSPEHDDLRALYERDTDAPVATGDHIFGMRVIGFHSSQEGDHILLESEEDLGEAPHRPLSCDGAPAGLERTGLSPVAALPADRLQPAPDGFRAAMEDAFDSREDGPFVRGLLEEIAARTHHAWLVGGCVRDLLSAAGSFKDFDMVGTIGPGCLNAMVRLRRRIGVGDYSTSLSPRQVWSVKPLGQRGPRLVEYKALARPGFALRLWGGGLHEDVTTRDLTFNALYYDRHHGVLADPCGTGRADLETRVMDTPYRGADPGEIAGIVVRSLKFRLRYQEIDISRMVEWIGDHLPDDVAARISEPDWKLLVGLRRRAVLPALNGHDELTVAGQFGQKAVRLVQEIKARS
jgi:hypothetical protein